MLSIKTYGRKSWFSRLMAKKEGYVRLGVPLEYDDWNEGW